MLSLWRANLLGSSSKGNEYFLRHLLGTDSAATAQEAPPDKRPRDVTWVDQAPEGKLDLLMTIDFRMTSSTILSDVILPAATWYEKHDLNTTDMHPFIHSFNPAIAPPWQTKTDWDAWKTIARASPSSRSTTSAPDATWSRSRSGTTPRRRWPPCTAWCWTGGTARSSRSPARRCRCWRWPSATTPPSTTR